MNAAKDASQFSTSPGKWEVCEISQLRCENSVCLNRNNTMTQNKAATVQRLFCGSIWGEKRGGSESNYSIQSLFAHGFQRQRWCHYWFLKVSRKWIKAGVSSCCVNVSDKVSKHDWGYERTGKQQLHVFTAKRAPFQSRLLKRCFRILNIWAHFPCKPVRCVETISTRFIHPLRV